MIYAIPNDGERVANHFVKAPYIAIYSDTDGMLKNLANIALCHKRVVMRSLS